MKKFGKFLSEPTNEKVEEKIVQDKNDQEILDVELIQYIIKEFPEVAKEIRNSLTVLRNTIEKSIDFIEDKSSNIVKETRNFDLSGKYRDANIRLHNISNSINDYSMWMNKELGIKEEITDTENADVMEVASVEESSNNIIAADNKSVENYIEQYIYIYEDFTGKNPNAFKLENHQIEVEGWDDMIVKTADILTKNYKNNRNSKIIPNYDKSMPLVKKSKQNELRDTIIEMLQEYGIKLTSYQVIVRESNE